MSIRVLLADDSDIMRKAILGTLAEDPRIKVLGEALTFAQTIELAHSLQPDVLLMDLHMIDEDAFPPELVRAKLSAATPCVLAISVWNDDKAQALAKRFGAKVLLDKANLYTTLLPAIEKSFGTKHRKPSLSFSKAAGQSISPRKLLP
jgi:two-component system nitrate/nitrite response regulator NarL